MWKRFTEPGAVCGVLAVLLIGGCGSVPDRQSPPTSVSATGDIQAEYREAIDLMKRAQWPAAIDNLEAITRRDDRLAGPHINLGIAYARVGDNDKAEAALLRAIERNAASPVAYNQLGILYRKAGAFKEAGRVYAAALRVAPDDPDTHWNLGILHDLYLKQPQQALQHCERYRQLTGSGDPQLLLWIAQLKQRATSPDMRAKVEQ